MTGMAPGSSPYLIYGANARRLAPGLLLTLMAVLLVLSSLHKRLTYDEYDNLFYGDQVLSRGPVPPRNGQRMPILALNALPCHAGGCRKVALDASEGSRLLVRAPTMAFALLLGLVLHAWAGQLFGGRAALLALALHVLNPDFLAHGKQVTSDVATAFFTVASLFAFWRLLRERGRPAVNLPLCALATAGALLSKYTSLLLVPILGILLGLEALIRRRRGERRALARAAVAGALLALLVLLFVNTAYLFRGTLTPADEYDWKSRGLQALRALPLPLPLPRVFVMGLDFSGYVQEREDLGRGYNYVLGHVNTEGVWYAFPLMLLLKTPLAVFLIAALAARRQRSAPSPGVPDSAFLFVPFAVVLLFFSLLVEPQLGIRYILPAVAFLVLYGSAAAATTPGRRLLLVGALLAWQAVSVLSYHPHYMSYFNELIGPRLNAYRFLADSNLDWEDRTWDIERFRMRHPEIFLVVEPSAPCSGWILVGANRLVGVYEPERYRWLRDNFRPVGHVGYSYLLFHVTPERLREVSRLSGAGPSP